MNTEKINALNKIYDALEIVENSRSITDLSQEERYKLEKTSLQLRNIIRVIIRSTMIELTEKLKQDNQRMEKLIKEIQNSSEKLSGIAKSIQKVNEVILALINITTQSIGYGLI
jgi:uncharacterized membrane protein